MEEGVSQQPPGSEAQQHLQQVLVLVCVGLDRDEEEDEEGSSTDQQSGTYRLDENVEKKANAQKNYGIGSDATGPFVSGFCQRLCCFVGFGLQFGGFRVLQWTKNKRQKCD